MITSSGYRILSRRTSCITSIKRHITAPATQNAAPSAPPPSTTNTTAPPPATTKPGTAQPFSEPFFPSTSNTVTTPLGQTSSPKASAPIPLTSSCPAGTSLAALTYVKAPSKPLVALEDHEYPAWLWTLISDGKETNVKGGVDLESMSKKTRAKYERKMAKLASELEKPVPLHEQSRDLTSEGEGADVHMSRQRELTQSMREARRKGIREANFLRSM